MQPYFKDVPESDSQFGLSWQIVPIDIAELIASPAALAAMLQMSKLDIAGLRAAAG